MAIDLIVAQDGSGHFTRISDAIHAAPSFSTRRYYIRIKEGLYIENVLVGKEKTNLALIGDGMDKTVISGNKSHGGGFQTNETPTVGIKGFGFIAQNITFRNTAGPKNGQAVALSIEANRAAFYKCRFQAYQDTLYTRGISQFFRDCEIYGTIDFIFGDATGWLEWEGRGVDKVYYAEYKNKGPGANIEEDRVKWSRVINSSATADKFSVRNFIEGDKWIPSTGIPFFLDLL
ncbi:plant invertase/pectin methylesterase inhibitor superfamily [Actinidia rufa]|uniref:Pectinesterase n=1 Tax=Actinidia rufa TaxID=165716 RepID=A0A7J0G0P1_9ERIC|nr:plant invertase/pectin methylesterase inhibitor superfamily [Actinidia rufa]